MFVIMFVLDELGEKFFYGGIRISLVYWIGIKLRLSFFYYLVFKDYYLIINLCLEKVMSF